MSAAPPDPLTVGRCSRIACESRAAQRLRPDIPLPRQQRQLLHNIGSDHLPDTMACKEARCAHSLHRVQLGMGRRSPRARAPGDAVVVLLVHRHPQRQHVDRLAIQLHAHPVGRVHPARSLRRPRQLHRAGSRLVQTLGVATRRTADQVPPHRDLVCMHDTIPRTAARGTGAKQACTHDRWSFRLSHLMARLRRHWAGFDPPPRAHCLSATLPPVCRWVL
jgi:hypothetical protein